MSGTLRISNCEPDETTRENLKRYLIGMDQIWLEADCSRYEFFAEIVSQTTPEIAIIDIDSDDEKAGSSALGNPGKAVKPPPQNQVEDDGEVLCEETLTCAEVIQKKFDQAAANGEVVDID